MPGQIVASFINAIERRDLAAALDHLSPDVEYDNVPMGKVQGRAAVEAVLGPFIAPFDTIEWVVHHQVAEGDRWQGVVMNERIDRFGAGDRWLELPVAGLFLIEQGLITLWRDYFDRDTLLQQMAGQG
ncbi:MAG: hypothetical protein RLZ14_1452 [Actinomycetota bacterium]|jgi:limonene-1,2-epoxide hydrolase